MSATGEFTWGRQGDIEACARVLAWDGRLDNRADLEWRFGRPACTDHRSDAALALAAYRRCGLDGLAELIGDWSLAIHDPQDDSIVLASDYAGARPLFYRHDAHRAHWSPALAALVAATSASNLDEEYVRHYLVSGGCADHTPYAGIRVVPPGEAVRLTASGATRHRLWQPPASDSIQYRDERRYDEQLRALFREAVSVRLQAAAPAVAELSGGFDSSSVVCMAAHLIRSGSVPARQLVPVTYAVPGSADARFVSEIERWCGVTALTLSTRDHPIIGPACGDSALPEASPLQGAAAAVALDAGARVFLTGQGGDLVMGNWFDDSLQVAAALRQFQPRRAWQEALAWSRVLRMPVYGIVRRGLRAWLSPASFAGVATTDTAYAIAQTSMVPRFCAGWSPGASHAMDVAAWREAPPERRQHWLALDRTRALRALQRPEAMAAIDYTHPYSHRPLVEFLMAIPAAVLCGPGEPRRLMRRALADLWPAALRGRRSKALFGGVYCDALRRLAVSLPDVKSWRVVEHRWVDPASLASRLERLSRGLECNEPQLRRIVLLECWLRSRQCGHAMNVTAA
jgi:asparagine synthase (glutamine-hydrolysing)